MAAIEQPLRRGLRPGLIRWIIGVLFLGFGILTVALLIKFNSSTPLPAVLIGLLVIISFLPFGAWASWVWRSPGAGHDASAGFLQWLSVLLLVIALAVAVLSAISILLLTASLLLVAGLWLYWIASKPRQGAGAAPGLMQWIIGIMVLFALIIIPLLSGMFGRDELTLSDAISESWTGLRFSIILMLVAAWVYWVASTPRGGEGLKVPLLAITTAFLVGAVVMILAAGRDVPMAERLLLAVRGYAAMVDGAFLKENALPNTLVAASPLILTGLGVALGFRAGLFNIGAEGQFMIGALCGVFVGYAVELPPVIHAIAMMLAGAFGGALWGAIPGVLKAKLGAHEVINTIMMNFIAIYLADWLINNPMKDVASGSSTIRTPFIHDSAFLAKLSEIIPLEAFKSNPLHVGFFVAIGLAIFVWWLLWKTTIGFELRTAGSNLDAARYAGMRADRTIILAMALSGSLAGLAGAIQIQGVTRNLPAFFSAGYGFDAIAVALLAFNHPIAVIPAGLLFGALQTGSEVLQIRTGVSKHIVSIIQALILLFVAAPALIRWIYRIRSDQTSQTEQVAMTRGWGG
jgi:general nucleoside transport system permease protein